MSSSLLLRQLSHTGASTRANFQPCAPGPPSSHPPRRNGRRRGAATISRLIDGQREREAGERGRIGPGAASGGNGWDTDGSGRDAAASTVFVAETMLPTRSGSYRLRGYRHSVDGWESYTEPAVVVSGRVEDQENVPVRVHDACFTSEVLGSLKCDCAQQLQLALEYIQNTPPGIVIYLQQEGRGIGLSNKIAAYALQERGLDTVDANRALGLPDDCREYSPVPNILEDLRIKSIQLMTNNPRKLSMLEDLGIRITGRIPCIVGPGKHNQAYLSAKEKRMDHLLEGSWCYWNHDGEPTQPVAGPLRQGSILPSSTEIAAKVRELSAEE
ncbi:unnamed protein product [Ostreobium quekettii]|uniref:GTP cyclohydrolase II n=1 Tax=Ostreobium quekettii TaxID=121088 RepID=A0A8S1IPU4_9CHLO|nr:unnamed protein product [Ostreobium quekettii]|eukprot:evm.model.scf_81.10 EVM.evm.TU.scf_81.10   scf_81:96672-101108(+)